MANTFSPFGFLEYYGGSGGSPTFAQSTRLIASGNATAIYCGDAVVPVTSSATGYIKQATASTVTLAGIFVGCKYLSTAQKRTVWSRYWPGSDATGDVEAYVVDDPNAQFLVQASGSSFYNASYTPTTITSLPLGQYCQLNVGTGTTATGASGMYIDTVGTTVTYPFVIRGLVTFPPGQNGTDYTTNYPYYVVGFNNEALRSNGAGPTGIS